MNVTQRFINMTHRCIIYYLIKHSMFVFPVLFYHVCPVLFLSLSDVFCIFLFLFWVLLFVPLIILMFFAHKISVLYFFACSFTFVFPFFVLFSWLDLTFLFPPLFSSMSVGKLTDWLFVKNMITYDNKCENL